MKRLLWYINLGFALLLSSSVNAQDCEKENYYLLGLHANEMMYYHYNAKDYQSAIDFCTKKIEYYFKAESWAYYIYALNDRAFLYDIIDDLSSYKEAVFSNFEEAEKYLEKSHPQWLRAKEQINSYYYNIGDYKKALEIVKEVIPIQEESNAAPLVISNTYLNLGTNYNKLKDTENALSSFKKSIKVLYTGRRLGLRSGERFNNIARTFKYRGELDSALIYLDSAESLFDTIMLKHKFKAKKVNTYILLAETWLEKKDFKKSKYYLDLTRKLPLNTKETIIWHERLAKYYRELGQFEKSINAATKATELAEETGIRFAPPLRARRNIDLTKTFVESNNEDAALTLLQESLNILAPTFEDEGYQSNPKSDMLFDKPDALVVLQEKARILRRKYEELNDIELLKSSYNTYLTACDVIRDVRQGIRSADSKNDLSERSVSVYEEAIQAAYQLSKMTNDKEYISMAFKLAESNKAQLLLENLNENEARGFEGIPDSLFDKGNDLKMYLAALEDRALREGKEGEDDDDIFDLRQELDQFSSFLENSYPRYFQLKYNNEPIDVSMVQDKILDDATALVEYFVGVEKVYVFVITKDQFFMDERIKGASDIEQIVKLRGLLKNRPGDESPETEYSNFTKSSRAVYTAFVQDAIDKLPESIKTLIIIPDDQINYIPFEVLLVEDPNGESSYSLNAQSYLFEKYAVNYNYSATLLNKVISKETSNFKANFIGYAPTFSAPGTSGTRSSMNFELSSLKCNMDEVNDIESMIGGAKRISDKATKDNFLKEVNDYKIVHLATHAFVNPNDSKLNRIFLQDDFLSDVNLYNLELNTELAVLSACNTGSGELLKGEGVMNLARGFINAGCSSTLMSMWSVDDCTTADLMLLFYKGIKNGLQKDEALQKAKIEYLETANKTKLHPYYWAAFIPFGDMEAMDLTSNWFSNPIVPIGLIIGLFVVFLYYNKK